MTGQRVGDVLQALMTMDNPFPSNFAGAPTFTGVDTDELTLKMLLNPSTVGLGDQSLTQVTLVYRFGWRLYKGWYIPL